MKSLITLFTLFSAAWCFASPRTSIPKFDLEMTGFEYRALQNKTSKLSGLAFKAIEKNSDPEDAALDYYISLGQKNLQWVDLINQNRPLGNKISLSSPARAHGFPISSPRVMNFKIIKEQWDILKALLPAPLHKVIFDGEPISQNVPVTDREFVEWLLQVDDAYQLASRYKMMKPWKDEMAEGAAYDVRGYLQINEDSEINQKLGNWSSLSDVQKDNLKLALKQICWNSNPVLAQEKPCLTELQAAIISEKLKEFKDKYMSAAKANYESFFVITQSRTDVKWDASQALLMEIPFADPHNAAVFDYLKFNIEDEYQWNGWKLQLNFTESQSKDMAHVVFVPGTTPHVNGLAGSEITMDANAPLSEYDVQWTIRHEFGHVLGFNDCYIEFYDKNIDAIISYQLDITDLMCSRRGHFQQKHFDELKRIYSHAK